MSTGKQQEHVIDRPQRRVYFGYNEQMLAACCQITSTANVAHNLQLCRNVIRRAASAGAKAIFLPEASDFIARNAAETVQITKEAGSIDCNAFIKGLQEQAVESAVSVTAGVHLPTDSETHVRRPAESDYKCANTAIWISPCGKVEHTYQKLHTFDVNIKGGAMLMESKSTQRGSQITCPFASPIGKIGLAICYDLRFPEMALQLRRLGADILTFPSAFTLRTGAAHWELLLRGTAVQTQCYVIAAAQVGKHDTEGKRQSYGHAMIVDPWGSIISQCGDIPRKDLDGDFCLAEINLDGLASVRQGTPPLNINPDMPLWEQRRNDVYPLI